MSWTVFLSSVSAFAPALAQSQPASAGRAADLPELGSERVVVVDAATDEVLLAKNEREVGGIASTSKIFVGMVVRQKNLDLDGVTEMTRTDRDYARGGARTRLEIRHSFRNRDLLRAMLIASDNRAPTALGRAVGLTPKQLIAAMNRKAAELGLKDTVFTDPSGLRGNESTARDMAVAFKHALADPVLAEIMGTRDVTVRATHKKSRGIYYRNTNQPLHDDGWRVLGGKTGYTRKAGYCLLIAVRIAERDIIMVFLGGAKKHTRFRDFYRVARWIRDGHAPEPEVASSPTEPTPRQTR